MRFISIITKIDAAKIQIDTAIRMLFNADNPIPIHTLSMAGFRILRDIAKNKKSSLYEKIEFMIKPEMMGEFWKLIQKYANFIKHADKDPEGSINNFNEEINDSILFLASLYYQDVGCKLTPEMLTITVWYSALHPDFIIENTSSEYKSQVDVVKKTLIGKSRKEQLNIGKQALIISNRLHNEKELSNSKI